MLDAVARRRQKIVAAMLFVIVTYGATVAAVSADAARTVGIGYIMVMVTLGVLLLLSDVADRRARRRDGDG